MAWVVMNNASILRDSETGEIGVRCGCSTDVVKLGNDWKDVTSDFTWHESVIPDYCAMLAGNNVLHVTASMYIIEDLVGPIRLFETTKWSALIESQVPIMVVHRGGTVSMITGYYNAAGYVEADMSSVTDDDRMYMTLVVPVE